MSFDLILTNNNHFLNIAIDLASNLFLYISWNCSIFLHNILYININIQIIWRSEYLVKAKTWLEYLSFYNHDFASEIYWNMEIQTAVCDIVKQHGKDASSYFNAPLRKYYVVKQCYLVPVSKLDQFPGIISYIKPTWSVSQWSDHSE